MAYEEGASIGEVKVTPDKYLPHRYAGASGDFNPIHIDNEFATMVGLPSTILHGLWSLSQVQRAAIEAAGNDPTKLKALSGQFRGMGVPEKEVTVTGRVKTVEASGEAIVELEAEQDGKRIIRNATAIIEP
ncbi:MAG: MaoC/PaaZ C-terminal domain-containing protein [Solirubrobacterales bacterium]